MKDATMKSELLTLKNVGRATVQDLALLGITTIEQLKDQNPDQLFERLQKITGCTQNPCVWDIFAAIVYQAQTGQAVDWWHFTHIRKKRS